MIRGTAALIGALLLTDPALAAVSGRATSSSVKRDDDTRERHTADRAVDGLLGSGWGEGEDGYGEGTWLELDLGRITKIQELSVWPGDLSQGKRSFREHSRPRVIEVTLSGGGGDPVSQQFTLEDEMKRVDLPISGDARRIRIDVVEVYEGLVFSDLFIAEVAVNFRNCRDQIQPMIDWMETDQATREAEKHEDAVRERYAAISEAQFGDDEALAWILDRAGDGPDYARAQAVRRVDVGFRAAAIRPSAVALRAIDQLKDPNGIPGLEMAALRAFPKQAEELADLVEQFYAHQELIGGPRFSVPAWGDTGWESGAFQSFEEPLPIEIDDQGMLYIADIGNSRIQQFDSETGLSKRQWGGGEAAISDAWIGDGRPWYVSGAAPGTEAGQFQNTLDVELMPDKKLGTSFAVLDGSRRVQIYDPEGALVGGWTVDSGVRPRDGLGGEAFIAWIPKKDYVYVILGNRMYGYTRGGEVLGDWKLADGVPHAVEVDKRGKLLMAFGQDVVMYDLDGFRHGVVITESELGGGFEEMDLTLDEKKKLWVVTDQGVAFKFKNYGRLDYSVPVSERSLEHPRIAADDDMLYITDRDRIIRVDALQTKIDVEADAANAEAAGL